MADLDVSSVDFSLNSDETLTGLSVKQIASKIHDTKLAIRNLRLEIELYGDHLKKLEGHEQPLKHFQQTPKDGQQSDSQSNVSVGGSIPSNNIVAHPPLPIGCTKMPRRMSKSRSSVSDRFVKLSLSQKLSILQKEHDDLTRERKCFDSKSTQLLDGLDAVLEEASMSLEDFEKEEHEFRCEIAPTSNQDSDDILNSQHSVKKLMKFLVEKLKAKSTMSANLRIESQSLKARLLKLKMEAKKEEELGDSLSAIDFEQMEIENLKFSRLMEEKNAEVSRLKRESSMATQNLNTTKKKLTSVFNELLQVKDDLQSRGHLMEKIRKEHTQVIKDKQRMEKENLRLRKLREDYEVPSVLSYMEEKKEVMELRNLLKIWKRKVEIAQMMLKNQKPKLHNDGNSMRRQLKPKGQRSRYEVIPREPRHYLQNVVEGKRQRFLKKCISMGELLQGNSPSRRMPGDDQNQEGIASMHVSTKDEDSDLFGFESEKCSVNNGDDNIGGYDITANDDGDAITNGTLDGCNSDEMTIDLSEDDDDDDDVDNDDDDGDYSHPSSTEAKAKKQNEECVQE